jgi:hypothetical protein
MSSLTDRPSSISSRDPALRLLEVVTSLAESQDYELTETEAELVVKFLKHPACSVKEASLRCLVKIIQCKPGVLSSTANTAIKLTADIMFNREVSLELAFEVFEGLSLKCGAVYSASPQRSDARLNFCSSNTPFSSPLGSSKSQLSFSSSYHSPASPSKSPLNFGNAPRSS